MYSMNIIWFGVPHTITCDGVCKKSWGSSYRPHIIHDDGSLTYLTDKELWDAPKYQNMKPMDPSKMNTWCVFECERAGITECTDYTILPDSIYGSVLTPPDQRPVRPKNPSSFTERQKVEEIRYEPCKRFDG